MVVSIVFATTFNTTPIPTTKITVYFKESFINRHHSSNTKEYRLEHGVRKIRGIMTSKTRGYDIFNNLKDKDGQLKQELYKEDVKGLLSVCECSILGETNDISEQLLRTFLNNMEEQSKASITIDNTLRYPYHKNLSILMVQNVLDEFDHVSFKFLHKSNNVKEWLNEVQELARVDFGNARMTYRYEVQQISIWKNKHNFDKELSFARIDPFKWWMWSYGILQGPNMSEDRIELAKAISFIYMIDDIFDGNGTSYDELLLFTEAINGWEYTDSINQLPNCMKVCFKALLETTNDFSSKILTKHGWNPEQCLRKLVQVLA
ncbi:hypothetical protein SOVF_070640 [Spinacia oleracea]|nr:hypothetical protein SOVF_070640 [Spinacia oleracea]